MLNNFISPGDRVELTAVDRKLNDSDKSDNAKFYETKIVDIISEDSIEVQMPIEQTKLILLPVDAEFNMIVYTNAGLYQCFVRVVDRYKSNNIYVLVLELTSNLRKYQRREYYRLNTVLDMKSKAIDENPDKNSLEQVHFIDTDLTFDNGTMVDIRGGGARFISKVRYTEGSLIRFVFSLFVNGQVTEYKLLGKVLKSSPMENREDSFENRIQFVNMVNDDRESIIKYIFEEERKMRHRCRQ